MSGNEGVIDDSLTVGRDRAFVGRQAELSLFKAALAGDARACPIHYLHGPGGIGKSMLLRRFAREAHRAGRTVVEVDGRTVDPTPEGFAAAAGPEVRTPGVVLLVDTFEKCQGLEGWLWERFLPRLPMRRARRGGGTQCPRPSLDSRSGVDRPAPGLFPA